MPLRFKAVADLLQALENNAANTKRTLPGWLDQRNKDDIVSWVKAHKVTVDPLDTDAVAVLSALFPDQRTDRVYGYGAPSLTKILGRCFCLGVQRRKQLDQWIDSGHGDLGACVERVLQQTEHGQPVHNVTLDKIDAALHKIASKSRFSAPGIRETALDDGVENRTILESVFRRLSSNEAKWLTRMILKDFSSLNFKTYVVFNAIDRRLAQTLRVHSTFEAAVGILRHQDSTTDVPGPSCEPLKPMLGFKIGRVPYLKGRSVKNVVQLAAGRKMIVEQKYDGEYCQIHVNLARGNDSIQIFSKSSKDSTVDRAGVHDAIRRSLRIGQSDCAFSRRCILEGEMLVYNDWEDKISEFHKIRKHVSRSGSFLGTALDSQYVGLDRSPKPSLTVSRAHEYEHLMIVYYDVMMIDDDAIMNQPHDDRRRRLEKLVERIHGRARVAKRKVIDFASRDAPGKLTSLLSQAFVQRWEGLVLKPCEAPYFAMSSKTSDPTARCWIKLKRDYIPGLGDSADFAVIGAGYEASRAAELHQDRLKWTHFHLGCLRNKKEVIEKKAKPCFRTVAAIQVNRQMTEHLNQHGQFCALPLDTVLSYSEPFLLDKPKGIVPMKVLFRKPFVFDVVGAGFDKDSNRDYYTLRFPRAIKIHSDRDWKTCVGFDELQEMAKEARTVPEDRNPEVAKWMKYLEQVDRGAKGSTVPWDLSDDDIEAPEASPLDELSGPALNQQRTKRPSVAPPMIRMDTEEMTEKEQRLDSGEVVRKPTFRSPVSNWSDSNLPTPPKSSPVAVSDLQEHQPLSSIASTNSTDRRRRRSSEDEPMENIRGKRPKLSPPPPGTKNGAGTHATVRRLASSKSKSDNHQFQKDRTPPPSAPSSSQTPKHKTSLVSKLSVGAAEALRYRNFSREIPDIEKTSPDRQTTQRTTEDEMSSQAAISTQESLINDWNLSELLDITMPRFYVPDLHQSTIILVPDVSGFPYLTKDLLDDVGLNWKYAHERLHPQPATKAPRQTKKTTTPENEDPPEDLIILMEPRRKDSSLHLLKYICGCVPRDRSQIFWVFNWRLVEDMYARGVDDDEVLIDKRLIARFRYGEGGQLKWVLGKDEVRVVHEERVKESTVMDGGFLRPAWVVREERGREPSPEL